MQKIRTLLKDLDYVCNGSIMLVHKKCGKAKCSCMQGDKLHGPYYIWTRKENGKTVTRTLTERQAKLCKKYINNMKKLMKVIDHLKVLSHDNIINMK
jgi:hypothetical protein